MARQRNADASPYAETLKQWRDEEQAEGRKAAEELQRQRRVTELECAFIAVRSGMTGDGDDQQNALNYAEKWGRLGRLLDSNPDLTCRPLASIQAEAGSPKAYTLDVIRQAMRGKEATAVRMLFDSWNASKMWHSEVLGWLTWRLEAEIMGKDQSASSNQPLPNLSRRQCRILRLMASKDYHATSAGDAMTRQAIVEALRERWIQANWRGEFSGLKKLGLTDRKSGSKGGVWLTPYGIEVAGRLPPNNRL
jgi:hypothetical protein